MATVNDVERQHQDQQDAQIWRDDDRACGGKITKKRLLVAGALAGATALVLGLSVGLTVSDDDGGQSDRIVGQAVDPNAVGCFVDERFNRVMTAATSNEELTPAICNTYCDGLGYAYYGLQWGKECWCAAAGTDLAEFGTGTCDYPCAGDDSFVCGGYLSFTVYDVGTEATTPTPTPTSSCTGTATVRFATETAYFEGGGCATLTDMYNAQTGDDGPLYVLDDDDNIVDGGSPTGFWLLTRDLRVVDGVTLFVHGSASDGDADVLRIQSGGSDDFYEIRAHGGSLSFKNTKVTSWDTEAGTEQLTYEGGRSYINCVSEVLDDQDCDGKAKNDMGECRMDIIDSVMGNLGWFDGESYGLTWKVRGFCKDLSNPEVFDNTNVYGDIQGSEIYGMYYGMYSYGHQGGVWTNNIMRDNILYGFDPHDDSDDLEIAYNTVYGNGNHGIIASKRCDNLEIHDNVVYDGGEGAVGIFLHRSTDDCKVYNNEVYNMQDAGLAIMESMNAEIYDNTFTDVKYGMRISLGGSNNYIHDNTFDGCTSSGLYTYEGSDDPYVSDGLPSENTWENNIISNTVLGVKIQDGVDNIFIGNVFTGTETFEFDDSEGTDWTGNTIPSDACVDASSSSFTSGSDDIPSC